MKIGANIPSLQAYQSMTLASQGVSQASLRTSSGLRINAASDDPAGLAIANKIRQQVRGLAQASENSSNGISMIQTAEGAMTAVHDMLQRIRELSVYAANETNEESDKLKMQDEIDLLVEEINAIPVKTEYNKIKLLNGECDRIVTTDTMNVLRISDTVPFGELNFTVTALPTPAVFTSNVGTTTLPDATLDGLYFSINDKTIYMDAGEDAVSLRAKIAAIPGLTVAPANIVGDITTTAVGEKAQIKIEGDAGLLAKLGLDGTLDPGLETTIALNTTLPSQFGPNASYKMQDNQLTITDANNFEVRVDLTKTPVAGDTHTITTKAGALSFQVGANKDMGMYVSIPKVNAYTIEIDQANVLTRESSTKAIDLAEKAIAIVSAVRSKLGAYQNRLEYTVSNLDNSGLNSSESLSRIEDTDMAIEMAEYAKYNVIYQAGTAMLAQSNARPEAVLQLLQ